MGDWPPLMCIDTFQFTHGLQKERLARISNAFIRESQHGSGLAMYWIWPQFWEIIAWDPGGATNSIDVLLKIQIQFVICCCCRGHWANLYFWFVALIMHQVRSEPLVQQLPIWVLPQLVKDILLVTFFPPRLMLWVRLCHSVGSILSILSTLRTEAPSIIGFGEKVAPFVSFIRYFYWWNVSRSHWTFCYIGWFLIVLDCISQNDGSCGLFGGKHRYMVWRRWAYKSGIGISSPLPRASWMVPQMLGRILKIALQHKNVSLDGCVIIWHISRDWS